MSALEQHGGHRQPADAGPMMTMSLRIGTLVTASRCRAALESVPTRRRVGAAVKVRSMAMRPILPAGDPRLREVAAPSRVRHAAVARARARHVETMEAADGAGLAAVQIGVPQRVVISVSEHNPRYPTRAVRSRCREPRITGLGSERESGWRAASSVPGMRGIVPR